MAAPRLGYPVPMIGRLRGELVQKLPNLALIECGGVGYAVAISLGTYGRLPEVGPEALLHVDHPVAAPHQYAPDATANMTSDWVHASSWTLRPAT